MLAQLEWVWMPALRHSKRGLKALTHFLLKDPKLFIDLLKLVYRAKNEKSKEVSEEEQARACQAYDLLKEIKTIPGLKLLEVQVEGKDPKIDVNGSALGQWVDEVRKSADECDRIDVCDSIVGQILAHSPVGLDGAWPCEPVRDLIEQLKSNKLENGIEVGVYNKRGVVCRAKGGGQERVIANRYNDYAEIVQSKWHRTANILRSIAKTYEREAKHYDERDAFEEFE